MKEVDYNLSAELQDGSPNPYKGKCKLKLLPYVQRNELLKKVNFKVDQEKAELNDNLDANARLVDVVKENLVSLDIKKGKKVFKSLEDLDYDSDVGHFYSEVGIVLCRGIDLGNG